MPLIYGKNIPLSPLPSGSVGSPFIPAPVAEKKDDNSFWSWIVTGITVIAEIAVGAVTGGLGAAIAGPIFAAIREGANSAIQDRDWSWTNFLIDAATPAATLAAGKVIKATRYAMAERNIISQAEQLAERSIQNAEELINKGISNYLQSERNFVSKRVWDEAQQGRYSTVYGKRLVEERLPNIYKQQEAFTAYRSALNEKTSQLVATLKAGKIKDLQELHKLAQGELRNIYTEAQQVFTNAASGSRMAAVLTIKTDIAASTKLVLEQIQHLVPVSAIEHVIKTAEETVDNTIRATINGVSNSDIDAIRTFVFINSRMGITQLTKELAAFLAKRGIAGIEVIDLRRIIMSELAFEGIHGGISKVWFRFNKVNKALTSHKTYEITKKAMDPSDIIDDAIKKAFSKTEKFLKQKLAKIRIIAKAGAKVERIFVETGGTLVNSDVIIGYKIILKEATSQLIQISFYRIPTQAKKKGYKNYGGKKPVYVNATDYELLRLRTEGMRYYLDTWAHSRGGRAKDGIFGILDAFSETALMLVHAEDLNKLLRLANLMKKNIENYQKAGFMAGGAALNKFKATAITKTSSLVGNIMLGSVGGEIGKLVKSALKQSFKSLATGDTFAMSDYEKLVVRRAVNSTKKKVIKRNDRYRQGKKMTKGTKRIYTSAQRLIK